MELLHVFSEYNYKLLTAQIPKAMVKATPPKLKMRMGASPSSSIVPTQFPIFFHIVDDMNQSIVDNKNRHSVLQKINHRIHPVVKVKMRYKYLCESP